jgi:hypothetical protein
MEGGVVVAGRSFRTASQCPTLILLFSGCFTVAGVVLTVLVYRPLTYSNTHYLQHLTGSQIGGPILVVVGLLFLAVGLALHIVSRRLKFPSDQGEYLRQWVYHIFFFSSSISSSSFSFSIFPFLFVFFICR